MFSAEHAFRMPRGIIFSSEFPRLGRKECLFPTFRVSLFVTAEQKGIFSGVHVIQAPVLRACMRITRHLGVSVHAVVSHRVACSDKKTPLPFSFSPWMAGFRNDADPPPDTKLLPQWRYCARVPYVYSECHRKHLNGWGNCKCWKCVIFLDIHM